MKLVKWRFLECLINEARRTNMAKVFHCEEEDQVHELKRDNDEEVIVFPAAFWLEGVDDDEVQIHKKETVD